MEEKRAIITLKPKAYTQVKDRHRYFCGSIKTIYFPKVLFQMKENSESTFENDSGE